MLKYRCPKCGSVAVLVGEMHIRDGWDELLPEFGERFERAVCLECHYKSAKETEWMVRGEDITERDGFCPICNASVRYIIYREGTEKEVSFFYCPNCGEVREHLGCLIEIRGE